MEKSQLAIGVRVRYRRTAYRTWESVCPTTAQPADPISDLLAWGSASFVSQYETRWVGCHWLSRSCDGVVCYAKRMPVCVVDERQSAGGRFHNICKNKKGSKMSVVVWVAKDVFSKPVPVMLEDLELAEATDQW